MSLLRKQVTFITAFFALMFVQAYGAEQGYASHHGISVVEREAEAVIGQPQAATEDTTGQDEPETPSSVSVDMELRHNAASAMHFEFCPVQLAEVSVRDWILWQQLAETELLHKAQAETFGVVFPPATVQVMRCVVMLI